MHSWHLKCFWNDQGSKSDQQFWNWAYNWVEYFKCKIGLLFRSGNDVKTFQFKVDKKDKEVVLYDTHEVTMTVYE